MITSHLRRYLILNLISVFTKKNQDLQCNFSATIAARDYLFRFCQNLAPTALWHSFTYIPCYHWHTHGGGFRGLSPLPRMSESSPLSGDLIYIMLPIKSYINHGNVKFLFHDCFINRMVWLFGISIETWLRGSNLM